MSTSNGVHHTTDEQIDTLYAWWPGMPPAPQPCPEAIFSCTLRGKLDGIETLLTVRGMTAEEFRQNLQQVRGLLDAKPQAPVPVPWNPKGPQASPPPASAEPEPEKRYCPRHGVPMEHRRSKKTGKPYWCHTAAGGGLCFGD